MGVSLVVVGIGGVLVGLVIVMVGNSILYSIGC